MKKIKVGDRIDVREVRFWLTTKTLQYSANVIRIWGPHAKDERKIGTLIIKSLKP